jgi:leucyl aminopeptidase
MTKEYYQQYYQENKDRLIQINKENYQKNKEHLKELRRLRYHKNKENNETNFVSAGSKIKDNEELIHKITKTYKQKEYKKTYYKQNKERLLKYNKERYHANKISEQRKLQHKQTPQPMKTIYNLVIIIFSLPILLTIILPLALLLTSLKNKRIH